MKKVLFTALLLTVFTVWGFARSGTHQPLPAAPKLVPPAVTFTTNEYVDMVFPVVIPCARENVDLTGRIHFLNTVTITGNRLTIKTLANPQGISGTGTISGDKYQGTGVSGDISSGSLINGQYSYTYTNNFRIIGQGTGNNLLISVVAHITVNADGTVTSMLDTFTFECR